MNGAACGLPAGFGTARDVDLDDDRGVLCAGLPEDRIPSAFEQLAFLEDLEKELQLPTREQFGEAGGADLDFEPAGCVRDRAADRLVKDQVSVPPFDTQFRQTLPSFEVDYTPGNAKQLLGLIRHPNTPDRRLSFRLDSNTFCKMRLTILASKRTRQFAFYQIRSDTLIQMDNVETDSFLLCRHHGAGYIAPLVNSHWRCRNS